LGTPPISSEVERLESRGDAARAKGIAVFVFEMSGAFEISCVGIAAAVMAQMKINDIGRKPAQFSLDAEIGAVEMETMKIRGAADQAVSAQDEKILIQAMHQCRQVSNMLIVAIYVRNARGAASGTCSGIAGDGPSRIKGGEVLQPRLQVIAAIAYEFDILMAADDIASARARQHDIEGMIGIEPVAIPVIDQNELGVFRRESMRREACEHSIVLGLICDERADRKDRPFEWQHFDITGPSKIHARLLVWRRRLRKALEELEIALFGANEQGMRRGGSARRSLPWHRTQSGSTGSF